LCIKNAAGVSGHFILRFNKISLFSLQIPLKEGDRVPGGVESRPKDRVKPCMLSPCLPQACKKVVKREELYTSKYNLLF
jgi:hypothetical protein